MKVLLSLLFLFININLSAQLYLNKSHKIEKNSGSSTIIKKDNFYYSFANVEFNDNKQRSVFIKLNNQFDTILTKTVSDPQNHFNLINTESIFFINDTLIGTLFQKVNFGNSGIIVSDLSGNIVSEKLFFDSTDVGNFFGSILKISNNYFLNGGNMINGTSSKNVLIKLDSNFNEINRVYFGDTTKANYPRNLIQTSEGKIIASGGYHDLSVFDFPQHIFVYCFDTLLNQQWQYTSPENHISYVSSITPTVDGGLIFSGTDSISNGFPFGKPLYLKFNNTGTIDWKRKNTFLLGDSLLYNVNGGIKLNNQTFINFGSTQTSRWINYDTLGYGLIVKLDTSANINWLRKVSYFSMRRSDNEFYDMIVEPDAFTLIGTTFNDIDAYYALWVVRTDTFGCIVPGCHLTDNITENQNDPFSFLVYPNPTSQSLNVYFKQAKNASQNPVFRLYDLQGRLLKEEKVQGSFMTYIFDLSQYPKGMLLLQYVENGEVQKTEKVVVN